MTAGESVLITPRSLQPQGGRHHWSADALIEAGLRPVYPEGRGPFPAAVMRSLVPGVCAAIIGLDTFDRTVVEAAASLRVVARFGAGYDRVDIAACTARGVIVTNTPDANTVGVAEHTLALMLGAARHVADHHLGIRQGRWDVMQGVELCGRRLGLVGLGRIGTEVARRCRAFGMSMAYFDVVRRPASDEELLSVQYMGLDDLLRWADVISLHASYAPGSRALLGERELAMMRPGAILINTARGELVDESALARALGAGHLAAAALDVFVHEPLPATHPLIQTPHVLLSPHAGAHTREAVRRMAEGAVHSVLDVLGGRRPRCVVNPEVYQRSS